MKTAIYIEDGTLQLVITPETEFEKKSLTMLRDRPIEAKIFNGRFYDCRGGWVRQSALRRPYNYTSIDSEGDESIIIRVLEPKKEPASQPLSEQSLE